MLLSFAAGHGNRIWVSAGRLRYSDLSADCLNFGAGYVPFKIIFEKCFKIVFGALGLRSGFGAPISL